MTETCKFPGCGRTLWRNSKIGVCADHKHSEYCGCVYCLQAIHARRRRGRRRLTKFELELEQNRLALAEQERERAAAAPPEGDWRGEHLIRNVKRAEYNGIGKNKRSIETRRYG